MKVCYMGSAGQLSEVYHSEGAGWWQVSTVLIGRDDFDIVGCFASEEEAAEALAAQDCRVVNRADD